MTQRKIDYYTNFTPNTWKIDILFEELGIKPDTVKEINIFKDEQFQPEFLKISPNNKIPAVLVTEGEKEFPIFETGAILMYFAEKEKKLIPKDDFGRYETIKWLIWQVAGFGPMLGQANHFNSFAKEKIPYAMDRYTKEGERLLKVLDTQLEGKKYVIGDEHTIADISIWPWLITAPIFAKLDISKYENILRWRKTLEEKSSYKNILEQVEKRFPSIRIVGIYFNEFLKRHGLKIISKTVYGMFVCTERSCPNNYHLREWPFVITRTSSLRTGFNVTNDNTCISCGMPSANFPCSTSHYNSLCMGSKALRLQTDPIIPCDAAFFALFVPLGIVLTIFIVIGLPLLGFYAIMHTTERELKEIDFKSNKGIEFDTNVPDKSLGNKMMNMIGLGSKIEDDSFPKSEGISSIKKVLNFFKFILGLNYSQKKWRLAMVASSSGINGIFDAYNFWFRYWGIWKFIDKFLLAIIVLFFFPFGAIASGIGLSLSLIIHLITIMLTILFRPYNALLSNILSIFYSICLILSIIYIFVSSIISLLVEVSIFVLVVISVLLVLVSSQV
eukprot:gene10691-3312_t